MSLRYYEFADFRVLRRKQFFDVKVLLLHKLADPQLVDIFLALHEGIYRAIELRELLLTKGQLASPQHVRTTILLVHRFHDFGVRTYFGVEELAETGAAAE